MRALTGRRIVESPALRPLLLLIALLVLWQAAVSLFTIPKWLIPAPLEVINEIGKEWPRLWRDGLVTGYASLLGFLMSVAIGIPLAMAIAYSRVIESFLYPILVFSQTVPKIAIAPLFVVWFGFGVFPKVISGFLLAFFPIVVATVTGFKSVDRDMIDLVRSMRASRLQTFAMISFPFALPSIFAGMKVAVTLAVVGAVVGEFVGSNSGLGYLLQIANGNFDLPLMFAALVVLAFIGVLFFVVLEAIERLTLPWHASQRADLAATL
ncbi:MAG TPA: ABC transporter permease [Alphaproteobacteria bacterium]|nr:ABC transporter permease [Alphaproteobacteria bacterium]